jgi:hypothetical protein
MFAPSAFSQAEFVLSLPVKCQPGLTCFIQNYVDHGDLEKARDFACGHRTYRGHDGTDIRIPDLDIQKQGVEVLAASSGHVTRVRDGIDDVSVRQIGKAAVAGKECGNGALIEHSDGWSTQYCHMAKDSVRVRPGDLVATGQPIGRIGLSGETEFPHLHLTVRFHGAAIDPFAFQSSEACGGGRSLWLDPAGMAYRPREIINFGFAGDPVGMEAVESGQVKSEPPKADAKVLVAYVRAIGLQAGDTQTLTIHLPDRTTLVTYRSPALDADKAQHFLTAGRSLAAASWPTGIYQAVYSVTHNDAEVLSKSFEFDLKN